MLEDLPSEKEVAQVILADLTGDLIFRINRYKILLALDEDFGDAGVLLPGGEASVRAYTEARSSFVAGNFLSTIFLCQTLLEHYIGGHMVLDDVSREVHQRIPRQSKALGRRPQFRDLLAHAVEAGILSDKDIEDIDRVVKIRNPLSHFRGINDPDNLTRRAMDADAHPEELMFNDARLAISTVISIMAKTQFLGQGQFDGSDGSV